MKPIILVILGAAMLMPMMRHTNHTTTQTKPVRKAKPTEQFEIKKDTETNVHSAGFWIDRLP